ncbi:MAG: PmoA family protein [Planctomycetota bacterium]|nr:PmoA family protein [Planctomycetota bacterium]
MTARTSDDPLARRVASSLLVPALLLAAASLPAADADKRGCTITVSAGEFDRKDTPVSFVLPDAAADLAKTAAITDEAGAAVPCQQDARKQIWIILPELKAGQSRTYRLSSGKAAEAPATVEAVKDGGVVKITVDKKEVLHYQGEKTELPKGYEPQYQRGGYIHPVFTPSGKLVTDDYPPNHKHHHGIWTPWTKTEFEGRHPDFWNMGAKTGTVEFVALDDTWSGGVFAGFKARHKQVDLSAKPEPKTALNETWEVMVFRAGGKKYNVFDLTVTQECAAASPLVLPLYHYGGTGIRGNRSWDGKANCEYLTSEGVSRADTKATSPDGPPARARWCYMGGKVGGEACGIAMLDHPDNFRAPQPLRLHPTEPFIGYCASKLGDWKIEPGKPYVARYRFIVADGPPDKAELDRQWNDFAKPPQVTVK